MSYIIQKARIPYNNLIESMINSSEEIDVFNYDAQKTLISYLKSVPPASCDAQFDYFITKLILKYDGFYKKIDLGKFRNFIIEVIKEAKYDKHNTLHLYDC